MKKYRNKPIEVEAIQYQPKVDIIGVEVIEPEFIYDEFGEFYYPSCDNGPRSCDCWLSLKTYPTESDARLVANKLGGAFAEVMGVKTNDGREYVRIVLPFSFWKVREGSRKPIDAQSDEWLDYALHLKWHEDHIPRGRAFVKTTDGGKRRLVAGQWIVTRSDGHVELYEAEEFTNRFDPVNESSNATHPDMAGVS